MDYEYDKQYYIKMTTNKEGRRGTLAKPKLA